MTPRLFGYVVAGLLMTLGASGCKKPDPPKPPEVRGHVYDREGKPLSGVRVEFIQFPFSDMKADVPLPFGVTDKEGAFHLNGGDNTHVVPPRRYKVVVESRGQQLGDRLPKEYTDPQTTPVDVAVPPKGHADLVIRLQ